MSEYKKEFRYFTIFDYEKEQEYLSWMHECGWKFTMVYFPGIYCFEKCKPEKVIYQLDYNQEGRTHKAEYLQMFADCGWEYLLEFMGYSYFRKPAAEMKEDEGIVGKVYNTAINQDIIQKVYTETEEKYKNLIASCNFIQQDYNSFAQNILQKSKEECLNLCSFLFESESKED